MTRSAVLIARKIFSDMWGFFNSFAIPGFYFTPAQFFLGCLALWVIWKFIIKVVRDENTDIK